MARQCDRCRSPIDPLRTVLQIVEGLRDGRRYRLMLCEGCAIGFARWMAAPSPGRSAPVEVLDDDQADDDSAD